jgi:hypothetical protein
VAGCKSGLISALSVEQPATRTRPHSQRHQQHSAAAFGVAGPLPVPSAICLTPCWTARHAAPVFSTPAIALCSCTSALKGRASGEQAACVISADVHGNVLGVDTETGARRWHHRLGGQTFADGTVVTLCCPSQGSFAGSKEQESGHQQAVCFAYGDGNIKVLSAVDGAVLQHIVHMHGPTSMPLQQLATGSDEQQLVCVCNSGVMLQVCLLPDAATRTITGAGTPAPVTGSVVLARLQCGSFSGAVASQALAQVFVGGRDDAVHAVGLTA